MCYDKGEILNKTRNLKLWRKMTINQEYTSLLEKIQEADNLYYNHPERATLPDSEYDVLYERLLELEAVNPDLVRPDSPTKKLVKSTGLFEKVRHTRPMLSLEKVTTKDTLEKFLTNLPANTNFLVDSKIDGASLSLEYVNGELTVAATRGDGEEGDNITANALNVIGVLPYLPEKVSCSIRGEVIIPLDKYELIKDQFANPRNAAAGALRSKRPQDALDRHLCFVAYDLVSDDANITTAREALDKLDNLGFITQADLSTFCSGILEVGAAVDNILTNKDAFSYETDGVVVKANEYSVRKALGFRSKSPRWAVAYKVAGNTATTILRDVTWQVGKSGINAPVGELEPVQLSGTLISRVTLHNLSIIRQHNLKIGDLVIITRAGEVIPFLVGVAASNNGDEVKPPTDCASCGNVLRVEGSSLILRCPNVLGCSEQIKGRLVHWASRKAANIDAIGPSWTDTFVDEGLVVRPSGFYKLSARHLAPLDRMGNRQIERFLESIENSKGVGLRKALVGFSIPFVSEGTAKRLVRYYDSIEQVLVATVEELEKIEDIGHETAKSLHSFFNNAIVVDEVGRLQQLGVNLNRLKEDEPVAINTNNPFSGKTVVITGTLAVPRKTVQTMLESLGAHVSSSITNGTDFLIAGEKVGSKLQKAHDKGITVLTEDEALEMAGLM